MPVGVGFIMFHSAVGLLQALVHWKHIVPRSNAVLLIAFFATTAAFIWIQLANPGWLVINASYAIVYVWCDLTVKEQRRSEIDRKNEELRAIAQKAESAIQAKSEFLSRMSHDIRPLMDEKHIDFTMTIHTETPCIRTDRLRFNQISFNLLSNAAKFTPEGGSIAVESARSRRA